MATFNDPTFQDRAGQAAEARREALEQLRQRPAPDQAMVAQRQLSAERRATVRADKSSAKKHAAELNRQARAEALAKAAAPVPTDIELKAKRDARYAARKSRK